MQQETLYLAVALLDQYLALSPAVRKHLALWSFPRSLKSANASCMHGRVCQMSGTVGCEPVPSHACLPAPSTQGVPHYALQLLAVACTLVAAKQEEVRGQAGLQTPSVYCRTLCVLTCVQALCVQLRARCVPHTPARNPAARTTADARQVAPPHVEALTKVAAGSFKVRSCGPCARPAARERTERVSRSAMCLARHHGATRTRCIPSARKSPTHPPAIPLFALVLAPPPPSLKPAPPSLAAAPVCTCMHARALTVLACMLAPPQCADLLRMERLLLDLLDWRVQLPTAYTFLHLIALVSRRLPPPGASSRSPGVSRRPLHTSRARPAEM